MNSIDKFTSSPSIPDSKSLVGISYNIDKRKKYRECRKLKMSRYNAAIVAGYSRSLAEKHNKPKLPEDYVDLFEQRGVTQHNKVARVVEGMNAIKTYYDDHGNEHIEPDWYVRHKYFETMQKMCGEFTKDKTTNNVLVFNLADRMREAREKADAREVYINPDRITGAREDNGKVRVGMDRFDGKDVVEDAEIEE